MAVLASHVGRTVQSTPPSSRMVSTPSSQPVTRADTPPPAPGSSDSPPCDQHEARTKELSVARVATRRYDAALRDHGLRITQVAIMAQVRTLQPVSVSRLAAELSCERSVVARDVAVLERDGLVRVDGDADDRRCASDHAHARRCAAPAQRRTRVASSTARHARRTRPGTRRSAPRRHPPACRRSRPGLIPAELDRSANQPRLWVSTCKGPREPRA